MKRPTELVALFAEQAKALSEEHMAVSDLLVALLAKGIDLPETRKVAAKHRVADVAMREMRNTAVRFGRTLTETDLRAMSPDEAEAMREIQKRPIEES